MKILKFFSIIFIICILLLTVIFFSYTSFVDDLPISIPAKTDYIHPSRFLIKYETFISGVLLRPAYHSFVENLKLSGNEDILDFGSGAGGEAIHLAKKIKNHKGSLTCLDISRTWLEVVKYRLSNQKNVKFIDGDITQMNLPDNAYDLIVLRLVLHDVPQNLRKQIVEIFYKILKPKGSIYIYEPIGKDHAIDENEMRSLFKNAGFKERDFKYSFSFVMIPPRAMGGAWYDK